MIKKDFKQKYFLLCPYSYFTLTKYSEIEQKEYIKQIKIEKI